MKNGNIVPNLENIETAVRAQLIQRCGTAKTDRAGFRQAFPQGLPLWQLANQEEQRTRFRNDRRPEPLPPDLTGAERAVLDRFADGQYLPGLTATPRFGYADGGTAWRIMLEAVNDER